MLLVVWLLWHNARALYQFRYVQSKIQDFCMKKEMIRLSCKMIQSLIGYCMRASFLPQPNRQHHSNNPIRQPVWRRKLNLRPVPLGRRMQHQINHRLDRRTLRKINHRLDRRMLRKINHRLVPLGRHIHKRNCINL